MRKISTPALGDGSAKRANDLDGRAWTRCSISVWNDITKSAEEIRLKHPAMFPAMLAGRLIEMFTREGMTVLDPFAGIGSTLVAARDLGRHGIGIELNPDYVAVAQGRLDGAPDACAIHHGDARNLLDFVAPGSVDLVVTSPPYWDILRARRTADMKAPRNYGDHHQDLGTVQDYEQFLGELGGVMKLLHTALWDGGYCCFVVMDLRKKDRFYPFHSDVARLMEQAGFVYDDLIVWDRQAEYNNLRPLGYPAVMRVNKVHEFVVIGRKR